MCALHFGIARATFIEVACFSPGAQMTCRGARGVWRVEEAETCFQVIDSSSYFMQEFPSVSLRNEQIPCVSSVYVERATQVTYSAAQVFKNGILFDMLLLVFFCLSGALVVVGARRVRTKMLRYSHKNPFDDAV